MKNRLRAIAIDHINMTVKNLKESVDFYNDLFGFEIRKDQPEDKSQIIGGDNIKLCLYEDPNLCIGDGINHFGFYIENFNEIVAKCKSLAVHMPYGIVDWGVSKSVYILDPSGYEIELSEVHGGGI